MKSVQQILNRIQQKIKNYESMVNGDGLSWDDVKRCEGALLELKELEDYINNENWKI